MATLQPRPRPRPQPRLDLADALAGHAEAARDCLQADPGGPELGHLPLAPC